MRISVLCRSEDSTAWQAKYAKQKGASDAQIAAVKWDFESGPFSDPEKLGLRCADRLHRSGRELDDEFYAKLKNVFTDQQIVELVATASVFEFFPRFVDGLRIPLTPAAVPAGKV